MNDLKLVEITKEKVKAEKKLTAEIISYLQEISDRRLYVEYKVDSLHKFCVRILRYSDAEAALRVKAVRVAKKLPEIKKQIETSKVSLSSVAKLHHFMQENPKKDASVALELISGKSARESEQILNQISEAPKARELKLKLNERVLKKLDRVQAAFGDCDELEAIEALIDEKLRELARAKAKRIERGSSQQRYIARSVREKVSKDQCENCGTRVHLQIEHIRPIAMGGQSTTDNLRILCRSCNQRQWVKASQGSVIKMS